MTLKERKNPSILNSSRKKRIAAGSCQEVSDINRLLSQFELMKRTMRDFNNQDRMTKNMKFQNKFLKGSGNWMVYFRGGYSIFVLRIIGFVFHHITVI
jgi:signal recognition particle subunit SRP54